METQQSPRRRVQRMQAQVEVRQVAATILEAVAKEHGTTGRKLCSRRGPASASLVKFEAAWLMRRVGLSWPIIGKTIGYTHHSQAIHAVRRWEQIQQGAA